MAKSKQELMMEEAEKREQERMAKEKNSSWIGSKKPAEQSNEAPKPFKANPWAVAASKGENPTGMKFVPLQQSQQEQKMSSGRQEQ